MARIPRSYTEQRGWDHTDWSPAVGVGKPRLALVWARALVAAALFVVAASVAAVVLFACAFVVLPSWLVAEAVFVVWFYRNYYKLNAQPQPIHRPAGHERGKFDRSLFNRFIEQQAEISKYICIKEMLSRWHWGVPADQLTKANLANLLTYGFYYRTVEEMRAEGLGDEVDRMVSELEAAWGLDFPEGPDRGLPIMRHLTEPVRCFYRPLAFYAGVEVLIALKHMMLLGAGFKAYTCQGLRYYTYNLPPVARGARQQPPSPQQQQLPSDPSTAPVLFLHGVGLGLLPYLYFLFSLACLSPRRPAVAVEVRHLSMRLCSEVPDEDEVVRRIAAALDEQHVGSCHVVGHSYGTFMASRLLQLHPHRVASVALLDPVCFIMYNGKLIYNFVYRTPLQRVNLLTWFIARDMAHAVSVSRRFYWSQLNLWPDQLPQHTLVAVGYRDELVPVPEVLTMLSAHETVRVLQHPTHKHASFIIDLPWQNRMVQEVAELIAHACPDASGSSSPTPAATATVTLGRRGGSAGGGKSAAGGKAVSASLLRARAASSAKGSGQGGAGHSRSDSASSYLLGHPGGSDGGAFLKVPL